MCNVGSDGLHFEDENGPRLSLGEVDVYLHEDKSSQGEKQLWEELSCQEVG